MTIGRLVRMTCVLAIVPSLAVAQRGMGGGGGRGGRSPGIARDQGLQIPKLVNGVNLLIEHRQELALTDSQFMRIISVKRALDSTDAPLMRRLDSIQFLFKGGGIRFGGASGAQRDSLAEAHAVIRDTQVALRENISEGQDRAYALLSATQAAKAQDIEAKAEKALADEAKGKPGGG